MTRRTVEHADYRQLTQDTDTYRILGGNAGGGDPMPLASDRDNPSRRALAPVRRHRRDRLSQRLRRWCTGGNDDAATR